MANNPLSALRLALRKLSATMAGGGRRPPDVAAALANPAWPAAWPFADADFRRQDESRDARFYDTPRLVYHIDEYAVRALTAYYARTLPPKADILDCTLGAKGGGGGARALLAMMQLVGGRCGGWLTDPSTAGPLASCAVRSFRGALVWWPLAVCSSWVSHLPDDYEAASVTGLGMVAAELDKNPRLTARVTQDLNMDPALPFADASFDVITNVVSVDYLTRPLEIFREMARVLRPGGVAVMSFSNRCFPTKAIDIWLRTGDVEHAFIVGCYFHYAGGFGPPAAQDISPNPGVTDPMYIVRAMKR